MAILALNYSYLGRTNDRNIFLEKLKGQFGEIRRK
jgi:hypothetical protein